MADLARLAIQVNTRDLDRGRASLRTFAAEGDRTGQRVEQATGRIDRSARRAAGAFDLLGGALAAISITQLVGQVAQVESLDTRLSALSGTTEQYARNLAFAQQNAERLGVTTRGVVASFADLLGLQQSGLITQERAESLTIGLINAQRALGLSSAEAGRVTFGLSQALSQGTVRAEEFNQVVEPIPGLLARMEQAAGLGAGQLRQLQRDGGLTSETFSDLLVVALQDFEEQAAQGATTTAASFARIQNSADELFRALAPGVNIIAGFFSDLINSFTSTFIPAVQGATGALIGVFDQAFINIRFAWNAFLESLISAFPRFVETVGGFFSGIFQSLSNLQQQVGLESFARTSQTIAAAFDTGTEATDNYAASIAQLTAQRELEINASNDAIATAIADAQAKLNAGEAAERQGENIESLTSSIRSNTAAQDENTDTTNAQQRAFNSLIRRLDPSTAAYQRHAQAVNTIAAANLSSEEAARLYGLALQELQGSLDGIEDQSTTFEGAWRGVDGAIGTVIRGVVNDTGNAFDSILSSFRNLLANLATEAISTQIQLQLGLAADTSGGAGGAGQQAAGGAVSAGGIYGAIAVAAIAAVSLYNDQQAESLEELTSEFRQSRQSTGTLLGIANEKSTSIDNSISEIESTGFQNLGIANSMLQRLVEIRDGIRNAAAGVARFTTGEAGGVATGVSTSSFITGSVDRAGQIGNAIFDRTNPGGIFGQIGEIGLGLANAVTDAISRAIFNTKVTIADSGIRFLGQSLGDLLNGALLEASQFVNVRQRRRVFGLTISDRISTQLQDLDAEVAGQFAMVFQNAGLALGEAADQFGIDFESRVNDLIVPAQDLSLQGLEGQELVDEIEAFFSSTLDNWASVLLDGTDVLTRFQEVGEGAFETMVRLGAQTQVFSEVANAAGLNFDVTGIDAVLATQDIASSAGGFEALSTSLQSFANNFIDDARLIEILTRNLGEQFGALGFALPRTRDQFVELVRQQDLTTESGRSLAGQLLALSEVTDQFITALDRHIQQLSSTTDGALESLRSAVEAATADRQSQFDAAASVIDEEFNARIAAATASGQQLSSSFTAQISAAGRGISQLTSLAELLRNTAAASIIETRQLTLARRRAAQNVLSNAIATGDLSGVEQAANVLGQDTTGLFSSDFEARFDAAVTSNQLLQAADLADSQASAQERAIAILESSRNFSVVANERLIARLTQDRDEQKAELERAFNLDVEALNAQLASAESQLNELRGINDSNLTIEQATRQFQEALQEEREIREDDRQEALIVKLEEVRQAIENGNATTQAQTAQLVTNTGDSARAAQDTLRQARQV